jgi:hypothetical protein
LAKKPQPTVKEALAISEGLRREALERLAALGKRIKGRPALLDEQDTARQLIELARDDDTSREVLALLGEVTTARAVDVIYEVWTGTRGRTDATALAESLVYSKELRPKASEALSVALDLRKAEDPESCEERKAIVERAVSFADRRSLHLLGKLNLRRGCGPARRQDCHPCLREGKELAEAIEAARQRRGPEF